MDFIPIDIGKYKLTKELGSGSFGTVFVCVKGEKEYAIKRINGRTAEMEGNFVKCISARLNCKFLVKYLDSFQFDGNSYIVMEYCPQGDLGNLIKTLKKIHAILEPQRIINIFIQLLLALYTVHRSKLIHRDLKPDNIFVDDEDHIKVGDFGLAREFYYSEEQASTYTGTPLYMSPEILNHVKYNSSADMWALGVVLYELWTLKVPFPQLSLIFLGNYTPLPETRCPREMSSIIASLLNVDPTKRLSALNLLKIPFIQGKAAEYGLLEYFPQEAMQSATAARDGSVSESRGGSGGGGVSSSSSSSSRSSGAVGVVGAGVVPVAVSASKASTLTSSSSLHSSGSVGVTNIAADIADFIEATASNNPSFSGADFRQEFEEVCGRRATMHEVTYFLKTVKNMQTTQTQLQQTHIQQMQTQAQMQTQTQTLLLSSTSTESGMPASHTSSATPPSSPIGSSFSLPSAPATAAPKSSSSLQASSAPKSSSSLQASSAPKSSSSLQASSASKSSSSLQASSASKSSSSLQASSAPKSSSSLQASSAPKSSSTSSSLSSTSSSSSFCSSSSSDSSSKSSPQKSSATEMASSALSFRSMGGPTIKIAYPSAKDSYSGEHLCGKPHGSGVCVYHKDGARYEGEWLNGKREGKGKIIWPDKEEYVGDWKDDMREGMGVQTDAKNRRYEGEYKKDKKEGHGTMTWPHVSSKFMLLYAGEWKNNKKNGKGVYTDESGRTVVGEWWDDKLVSSSDLEEVATEEEASKGSAEVEAEAEAETAKEEGKEKSDTKPIKSNQIDSKAELVVPPSNISAQTALIIKKVAVDLIKIGVEKPNVIFGIDFTKSNEFNGLRSFQGRKLHDVSICNPYMDVIEILGLVLNLNVHFPVPCFGFGDLYTKDQRIFPFFPDRDPYGYKDILDRYVSIAPSINKCGPTSYSPLILKAIEITKDSKSFQILVIVTDGEPTDFDSSSQAIVQAGEYALSIICVGVGDGPWDRMEEFIKNVRKRKFNFFHFLNFTGFKKNFVSFAEQAVAKIAEHHRDLKKLRLV